ncbi:hypothetical protein IAR55_002673 [Kwoniella newhampshirensis]|uniref:POT family proton-dependent oligopeptide transporter n=1 Tax=Kwoniella newhampshirensis TaxID=1651941 RepID=A0AAW0YNM7_9TREE
MATTHSNALTDLQSAPIPSYAMPATELDSSDYDKKEGAVPGVTVTAGDAYTLSNDQNHLSAIHFAEGDDPTPEEESLLRKIPGKVPWVVVAMCAIELAERASYYGTTGVVTNFVKNPLPKGGSGSGAVASGEAGTNQSAGALGKGSVQATAITTAFTFLAYVFPIMGGILADTKLGRFKTVCIGTFVGFIAHILLVISSIPSIIAKGHAIGPFLLSYYILSMAAGFIKPCIATLLCDQSPVKKPVVQTTKTGERVIVDPSATVQRYLLIFYWCINVGSFFAIAGSYSARFVGFWLAYLIPGVIYMIMPLVLWISYKRLYIAPPQGSVVLEAYRVITTLLGNGGWRRMWKGGDEWWNQAKPSYILARDGHVDSSKVFWDDLFVEEIRQTLSATAVFMLIPIFNLADGGIGSQENDMSTAMTLNNAPNDLINNFNPLTIIVFTPIITYGLYPFMEKIGRPMKPMTRICVGFMLGAANMVYGAIVQWKIYQESECGYYASSCDTVTSWSIWAQVPLYSLPAIGEIFVNVTSYELAYTRAPARMKGLVYAICLFNSAISAAIGLACSNAIQDPYLIWPYVALAIACFLCGIAFPTYFKHLNEPIKDFADPARQAGLTKVPVQSSQHEESLSEKR